MKTIAMKVWRVGEKGCDRKGTAMTIFKAKKVIIIEMTPAEAIRTIASLARQIDSRDMNTYRYELFTTDGVDFSIAVNCDPEQLKSASVAGK